MLHSPTPFFLLLLITYAAPIPPHASSSDAGIAASGIALQRAYPAFPLQMAEGTARPQLVLRLLHVTPATGATSSKPHLVLLSNCCSQSVSTLPYCVHDPCPPGPRLLTPSDSASPMWRNKLAQSLMQHFCWHDCYFLPRLASALSPPFVHVPDGFKQQKTSAAA